MLHFYIAVQYVYGKHCFINVIKLVILYSKAILGLYATGEIKIMGNVHGTCSKLNKFCKYLISKCHLKEKTFQKSKKPTFETEWCKIDEDFLH